MTQPTNDDSNRAPIKLMNGAFLRNPYPILSSLREQVPAFPMEGNGFRMWVVTRHADIRLILKDPALKKDVVSTRRERVIQSLVDPSRRARLPARSRRSLLDRDGKDHRRLRDLVSHAFRPQQIAVWEPRVRELAEQLVQQLRSTGVIDLHSEFATPLALTLVAEIVGVPESLRDQFPILTTGILTGGSVREIEQAGEDMYAHALRLLEYKRAHPGGGDLIAWLMQAHSENKLDDDELVSMVIVLMMGGLEPATAICNGIMLLLQHPEQCARLVANPQMLPACVEEVLRFESPFRMLPPRFADKAISLDGGVTIPPKEMIIFCVASANRDPRVIEDGDRFDISREASPHLSFGSGPHHCLGAQLGRLQTGEAIAAFLRRFPKAQLALAPEKVRWRASTFLRRVESLPLILGTEATFAHRPACTNTRPGFGEAD